MAEIGKVIEGLECCLINPQGLVDCRMNGCPYVKEAEETEEGEVLFCQTCLFVDALELLKEWKAILPFLDMLKEKIRKG